MKVALIHYRYIRKGGLETRLFNYIDYFLRRGDEVHLYTAKVANDIDVPKQLNVHLIDVKKIPKPFRQLFFNRKLKKVFKKDDFDFSLSLERTTPQKYLIAPNTHQGYLIAQQQFSFFPLDWVNLHLDKQAFRDAETIFACSQMIKREIETYYKMPSTKIKVVNPPTDLDRFNDKILSKESAREQLGIEHDKIYFLLVSTSHKRKGLALLEKVFKQLKNTNIHLLVAGTPFKDSGFQNIKSLGFMEDMTLAYAATDYTVLPAIYEPFGQVVVESLACKKPVIVSKNVGAKELINENNGIVVNDFLPNSWKNALEKMSKTAYNVENMNRFSLERHMEQLLELDDISSS